MADESFNPKTAATAPANALGKLDESQSLPPAVPEEVKKLSKEEQMAAFEEDLKNNDWGHQPC